MQSDRLRAVMPFFPGVPRRIPRVDVPYRRALGGDVVEAMEAFVRQRVGELGEVGVDGVVIGLSGGLDSTTAALLCRRALGRDRVHCVVVDLGVQGHAEQTTDAVLVARELDVACEVVDASSLYHAQASVTPHKAPFSEVNAITRAIHGAVFQVADGLDAAVVSTVDRSEQLLGRHMEYFYGHLAPLAMLYKTEVADLATHLGVPARVLALPPGCVDAWLDEEVFGVPYEILDPLLHLLVEEGRTVDEVCAAYDVDPEWLSRVAWRLRDGSLRFASPPFDLGTAYVAAAPLRPAAQALVP